uniref:Rotatin n=1 Tax=Dicentrarchus labrax TaxID=13489 RepID=A0A8C4NW54_DICLA
MHFVLCGSHSLVEIRVRALKSILCKLDHSLVSVSDIVQEKMLFVYLLEWFNFPEVPMQEEVLELLSTLSKHPSAAQMLRDVGAVDFLTQLSPNVEPRLRAVIDGTLDQLFELPELLPSHAMVYSHGQRTTTPTEHFPKKGYFHKSVPSHTDAPPQKIAVHESVRCLKFSVFPWLTLTNTDRHILSSNESSLRSSNPNLVRTTCELLCDVIMQDFPAEIFLQRPSIVKNLLSLLRLGSGKGEASYLHLQALSCLRQLCVGLRRRLRFHQDPSFYSTKQDQVSQNSSFSYSQEVRTQRSQASSPGAECSPRPSVVGRTGQRARGDGQDGDAASNSGSSHRGGAVVQAPRQPQSPADVTHLALPDMGAEDVLELQLQQLTLAQFTVATMEHAIPLLKTGRSHYQKEKLQACMEQLGDILSYHQSYSADIPHSSQVHHRMAYTGTAIFTIKLLQTILPPEKASDNLPESTATAIFHLCLDTSLGNVLPSMQETAVAYLEQVNSDSHDLYRRVTRAAFWMESTCNFLKEGEKNWLELLELADQAIDGLPFHQHLPIIKECVHICSYLWKFNQPSPLLQTESQKLLLKLLSHPLLPVKTETYECSLNLVKDCLGIQNVSRQEPGACGGVNFLLHHRVLYEISAFGLQDSVNVAAKDILLFLLKGRLMMTASTWDRFNEALYPVMPILQGYAGTEESLGNCVLLISDMSDVARDNMFPSTAKLKAALRLLFTKQPTVRIAAVQQILPHITSDDDANSARPHLDQPVISSLPNLYCLRNPLDITLDTSNKSVLKVESVEKLFSIMSSDTVDISLKRSAAEQLSVVLQGKLFVKDPNDIIYLDCLLEPCVCILRKLVYADPSLRHSLAQRNLLLLTLLRVLITLYSSAKFPPRYNIPFQAATHHAVSPYCCVLPPSSDLLTLAPARQALQVAWNTAWHSGIDNLLEELHGISTNVTEFHPDLKLSEAQVLSLRAVHLPTALQDCIQAIVTAAGHSSVTSALSRLSLYLLTDRLALPHLPTYSCRDTLNSLSWQAAVTRFLQVRPACVEDERLLVGIVAFLNAYFKQMHTESASDPEDEDLRWILELLLNQSLLNLLLGVETQTSTQSPGEPEELKNHVSQKLQRELTSFFNLLLLRLSTTTDRLCLALAGPFKSQLAVRLLQSLRVSDAPRFYGLPSLERTLQGMVSLTAQPGWSSHCPDLEPVSLCSKYLSGLLEVISSFYVEWGGNSLSFMGKGVTKNAVISLLHLSHEMMAENKDKWSLGSEAAAEEASASQLGLAWLIPLWVDRDQEVRFASLGLGAALSSVPSGCQALCASCQNISGGLWGTLLNILLDQQESSMVRREAAFILQNLLVMPMPANAEEAKDSHWQHPCVHDEVSGVSLVGLPALQALLYHCQYFQHVALSASNCYQGRYTFHLQSPVTSGPSPQESNSLGSDTDTSESVTSQDSRQGEPSAVEPVVMVTPDLMMAHCAAQDIRAVGLLLICLPVCFGTLLHFLSGFSKLLQSCVMVSQELIGQMDFLKHLLTTLVAMLMLDTKGIGQKRILNSDEINFKLFSTFSGLIDSCVEQMKQTHSQLHLESVRPGKASHRKKEDGCLKEVKLTVEILRSALYRNDECKVVATDARLTLALYALWPWLLLDDPTMEAVLELLCVYTADCTTACSSLCGSGPGAAPGSKCTLSNSLMHSVMKLASGIAPDNSPIQKLAFSLLANLAMSRECRGLLQKNNFVQAFLSVPVPKAGSVKATSMRCSGGSLLGLWLRLLVNLSFAEDGQQSILRVTGALELLADLAQHRRHALLTLHNLCFCPANKPHVITNDKAMKVLLCCLDSKDMEIRCMGASALWALLHNNQRVQTHTCIHALKLYFSAFTGLC